MRCWAPGAPPGSRPTRTEQRPPVRSPPVSSWPSRISRRCLKSNVCVYHSASHNRSENPLVPANFEGCTSYDVRGPATLPPLYWPIQAHGALDVVIKWSTPAHERPGTTSIRTTSMRATTNTIPVSTFTAVVFIALHDPSLSPSSGPPSSSSCGTAGCTTGFPRPLGAQLRRGWFYASVRLY
jgi:hypothetical protein